MSWFGRCRRAALPLAALALASCHPETDEPPPTDDGSECSGSYDVIAPGLTRIASPAGLEVELKDAEPSPPVVRRDNVWWLALRDADGNPLSGAEIIASPYMPKHQHGSAEVVVSEPSEGVYQLSPIELIMPGVWEIPLRITPPDGAASSATFRFCVAER